MVQSHRREPNGEKRVLWQIAVALLSIVIAIDTWAIGDYLYHKQRQAEFESTLNERLRWQASALQAIATKLEIPIPPPPPSDR